MIDDSLLAHLKEIGMSEYEARVYAILVALRVASARDIHEQTKIPGVGSMRRSPRSPRRGSLFLPGDLRCGTRPLTLRRRLSG